MKKIVIAGASGFVGSMLTQSFKERGYEVEALKREDLKKSQRLSERLNGSDVVINLSGANIINRWSENYKKLLHSSRIETTHALVEAMRVCENRPKLFISTSAIGIYKNDAIYDESTTTYSDDFLAKLCIDWEAEATKANTLEIRTAIFRFGIVLGAGGALAKMLTPFKLGVGGTIGDGSQAFSFIHIQDLINAYHFVIENEPLEGIFNLTAPTPSTNYGLTKALGKTLHRPTMLPIPKWILTLILSEGASVLTDGQSAIPTHLLESGFEFEFETIEESIEALVK